MEINVFQEIEIIFKEIIKIDFTIGLKREQISRWDSLNHVKLITKIEKKLQIKFSTQEAVSIRTSDELIEMVKAKCQKKV
jgi:acyl carrier protein